jgi:hypothetical protein
MSGFCTFILNCHSCLIWTDFLSLVHIRYLYCYQVKQISWRWLMNDEWFQVFLFCQLWTNYNWIQPWFLWWVIFLDCIMTFQYWDYTASGNRIQMNWKGCRRKCSWSNKGTTLKFSWRNWGKSQKLRKTIFQTEVHAVRLPNTNLEHYLWTSLLCVLMLRTWCSVVWWQMDMHC